MAVLRSRTKASTKAVQQEIAGQMKDLPLEWLLAFRDYAELLHKHALRVQPISTPLLRRPTVEVPANSLLGLIAMLPPIGGDALVDTEALYDQLTSQANANV